MMWIFLACYQFLCFNGVFIESVNATDEHSTPEDGIYKEIFTSYNRNIVPRSLNRKTFVKIDIRVQTIANLDVKTQVIKVSTFTTMKWQDSRLSWNSSKYSDEDVLNLDNTLMWTPDVVLYNDAKEDQKSHLDVYKSKVIVKDDGELVWITPVTYLATCYVDVTWFPMDKQICNLTFGSWSYHANKLNLKFGAKNTLSATILKDYHVPSGQWLMQGIQYYEEDKYFDCCPKPFSTVTISMTLVRYSSFYYLYIFLPFLSQLLLFLVIFHIKPEHGDRLSYGVALLLNLTMYMIFLSDKLPEKSDNEPLIGNIFVTYLFTLSLGLIVSSLTMWNAERTGPVPTYANTMKRWVNAATGMVTRVCCCRKVRPVNRKFHLKVISGAQRIPSTTAADQNDNNDDVIRSLKMDTNEDQADAFETWREFMRFVDKIFFYVFIFLLIIEPIIIGSRLDRTHLA